MTEGLIFTELPGFLETIARIARVPAEGAPREQENHIYSVIDETHKITYRLISPRKLTAADVRRAMVRAFERTDVWPDKEGVAEIQI